MRVFDDVEVGIGRTGNIFSYLGVGAGAEADVATLACCLGGGVPIGSMVCKEKYFVFRPGDHATTFSDNFLPRAAALAVLGEDESLEFSSTEDAQGGGGGYRMGT